MRARGENLKNGENPLFFMVFHAKKIDKHKNRIKHLVQRFA
jgi:hypothetical protein